jgi:uncharacterized protein (DUF1330 family)
MINDQDKVFLVSEVWLKPGTFDCLKHYRIRIIEILERFEAEYIYYGHPFDWVFKADGSDYPTGIEIIQFPSGEIARKVIKIISSDDLLKLQNDIFSKVRSYLSRYAPPIGLKE